jgi:hypothetical protein
MSWIIILTVGRWSRRNELDNCAVEEMDVQEMDVQQMDVQEMGLCLPGIGLWMERWRLNGGQEGGLYTSRTLAVAPSKG